MKKVIILLASIGLIFTSTACSSAQITLKRNAADVSGANALVRCFSGGVLVYESETDGKVLSEMESDGYVFVSSDGVLTEVSGSCIIEYK